MPREISNDEIFGMAKRITKELAELPLQTHGTIVEMLKNMVAHRHVTEQRAAEEAANAKKDEQFKQYMASQAAARGVAQTNYSEERANEIRDTSELKLVTN